MKKFKLSLFVFFIMVSSVFAQTWTNQTVPSATVNFNCVDAVSSTVVWVGGGGTILRTTNGGTNWLSAYGDLAAATNAYSISGIDENECWFGCDDGSVYHTTNGGAHWTFVAMPSPATVFVDAVYFYDHNIGFVLGDPDAVTLQWCYYWTTDAGVTWTLGPAPIAASGEGGYNGSFYTSDTSHIYFGTNSSKIYKGSFRGGFTSYPTASADANIFALAFFGLPYTNYNIGVVGHYSPTTFDRTTNAGVTWAATTFTPTGPVGGISTVGTYGWACSQATTAAIRGRLYITTNSGANWTEQTPGVSIGNGYGWGHISMFNVNTGWAVTAHYWNATAGNMGIYKYSDNLVGVNTNNTITPDNFKLEQNYPNPFNPSTTINYSIPNASFVTLKVYDVLGNEVKTLVNENQSVNNYSITADFSSLSSGIYFYTLKAGDFTSTKKLMLVK